MKNLLKTTLLLVFVFALSVPEAFCQLFTWEMKTPMPTRREYAASEVVNGKIYVIGGYEIGGSTSIAGKNEEYDTTTDTWTTKTSMNIPREQVASTVFNNQIYVIGGTTSSSEINVVEVYNPSTDTWSAKPSMPTIRKNLEAEVVNGKIYAIGGYIYDNGDVYFDVVEEFDPSTNTWTTKAPMPTARSSFSTCVVNDKIYVVGGNSDSGELNSVEVYDPSTDTWSIKNPTSNLRRGLVVEAYNNKIYAIGGRFNSNILSSVEEYDVVNDVWTPSTPMLLALSEGASSIYNGKIYVFGGKDDNSYPDSSSNVVEAFTVGNPSSLEENESSFPKQFSLQQNYPNPFNPNTRISFDLFQSSEVELTIYNSLGKEITTLSQGKLNSGNHNFDWNGTDKTGKSVSSGLYVYKLKTENGFANKKMLLIK